MQAINALSEGHPLNADPGRPWPYRVLIGYRGLGLRKIIGTRAVYVRATSEPEARMAAFREAQGMMPMTKDGKALKVSRIVSSRPLDKHDCYNPSAPELPPASDRQSRSDEA